MKRLLLPAFLWLLVMWLLGTCQQVFAYGSTVNNMGVFGTTASHGRSTVTRLTSSTFSVTWSPSGAGGFPSDWCTTQHTAYATGSGTAVFDSSTVPLTGGSTTFTCSAGNWFRIVDRTYVSGDAFDTVFYYQNTSTPKKKNIETFTNTRDYAVRYVYFNDATDAVLKDSGTVAPGATADMTFEYDSTVTLKRRIFVPADFSDGGWVEATLDTNPTPDPDDPSTVAGPNTTQTAEYYPPGAAPTTPTNSTVTPSNTPASLAITPGSQTVWTPTTNTTDNERLDKATYRVGVDKINDKLGEVKTKLTEIKTALTTDTGTTTAPEIPADPAETEAMTIPTPNVASVLPDPMEDLFTGSFTSVTAVSANMTIPAFLSVPSTSWNWSYDFSEHETLITVIRNFLKFVLVVEFFLLSTRTVRGALV